MSILKDYFIFIFKDIPKIIFQVKNWNLYLKSYFNFKSPRILKFRKNFKLKITDILDISSVNVIFIKKEYGNIDKKQKIILDIGANRGYFSIFAAISNPNATIYSFEPISETYNSILENIKLNKIKNIKTFNLGVSNNKCKKSFIDDSKSSIGNSYCSELISNNKNSDTNLVTISCVGLKDIIEDNNLSEIDLIKMDCEGAEYDIFLNLKKPVLDKIKEIRMEYHNLNKIKNLKILKNFFKKNNFKITKLEKNSGCGILWVKNLN